MLFAGFHLSDPYPVPSLYAALGPLESMKPNPPGAPADPVLLFIAVA